MSPRFSSLPLQLALFFDGWFLFVFYLFELCLLVYKALILPYPGRNVAAELVLLVFLAILDAMRVFLGVKGNLTEKNVSLLVSLVFIFPIFFGYLYLVLWQTYVLRVELVVVIIAFVGMCLELPLGLITLCSFIRRDSLG